MDYKPDQISMDISKRVQMERRFRLLMDATESKESSNLFFAALDYRFGGREKIPEVILSAWKYSIGIEYEHGNVPAQIYLNHPLRVATIIAKEVQEATEDTLVVALLHNVFEVSKISFEEIRIQFGESVAQAVQALTIDRTRTDQEYLFHYYEGIKSAPALASAVKVADKLDNIYMICFNPSQEIRVRYLDEIEKWVIPLALKSDVPLAPLLKETITVMRKIGFVNKEAELELARKSKII